MLSIKNTTHQSLPSFPFREVKDNILGKNYDLSLVFSGTYLMRRLSSRFKGEPTHLNILSFPLSKTEGEIFIGIHTARKEADRFNHGFDEHILFLFIHGCLHLSGYAHGAEMERMEKKILSSFLKKK